MKKNIESKSPVKHLDHKKTNEVRWRGSKRKREICFKYAPTKFLTFQKTPNNARSTLSVLISLSQHRSPYKPYNE